MKFIFLFLFLTHFNLLAADYPNHWWSKVAENERQGSWEILPQEVQPGEVILSKRNELGVFSNFAHTPFILNGQKYASIEGFWQMMKYPEPKKTNDPRNKIKSYPYKRSEVQLLHGFEAKKAGDQANKINESININWVSYQGIRFNYKDHSKGSVLHYQIIFDAIKAKIEQNPKVKKLLMKTKGLILKPDHHQGSNVPDSYKYFDILMKIRDLKE